jgi:hypothetical protein
MPIAGDVAGPAGSVILPFRLNAWRDNPSLDRALQAHIAVGLRQMYRELLDEPIPERFIELIAELDRKQSEEL